MKVDMPIAHKYNEQKEKKTKRSVTLACLLVSRFVPFLRKSTFATFYSMPIPRTPTASSPSTLPPSFNP